MRVNRLKALITGFEPYGKYVENPSEVVARTLPEVASRELPGVELVTAVLPVSFRRAKERLLGLLRDEKPHIYLGIGLRPGATHIAIERVAINLADARTPDNDGEQPIDEPIDPEGPAAYFSTLPVKSIVKELRSKGIPAALSNSAGTFLCNYVMYLGLNHSFRYGYPMKSGFIHVPFSQQQVNTVRSDWAGIPPSLTLDTMVKAVVIALKVTIERLSIGDERIAL
ncbi:MAG: pyroglutamyl-peptidase I [Sulfolobales archaeon]